MSAEPACQEATVAGRHVSAAVQNFGLPRLEFLYPDVACVMCDVTAGKTELAKHNAENIWLSL